MTLLARITQFCDKRVGSRSASRLFSLRPEPATNQLDLLYGVRAIGRFMGLSKGQARCLVRRRAIPSFNLDGVDCALKSSIVAHLKSLEVRHGERP